MSPGARAGRARALVLVCAAGFSSPSGAADLFVTSRISETFRFSDDSRQRPGGFVAESLSSVLVDAFARIETFELRATTDLTFRKATDRDNADSSLRGFSGGNVVSATKAEKDTTYRIVRSFTIVDASTSELLDSERTNVNTARVTTFTSGSVQHRLNRSNVLGLTTSVRSVDFTNRTEGLIPFSSFDSVLSWDHDHNRTTSFESYLAVRRFSVDNGLETQSDTATVNAAVVKLLSKRLTVRAGAGLVASNTRSLQPGSVSPDTTSDVSRINDFRIDYDLSETTGVSLSFVQSIQPSSLGALQNRTSYALNLNHSLNSRERLGFTTLYSIATTGGGPETKSLILQPSYSYQISPEWQGRLSYRFRQVDSGGGTTSSNTIFATLSRNFVLLP